MDNDKELFDYWHEKVELTNLGLIASSEQVQTQVLRHECTNYDQLRQSREVATLPDQERSKVIAVIKYQCTAKVLQRRAGLLRDRASEFEQMRVAFREDKSRLQKLIKILQEKLFGKDQEIKKLEIQVSALQAQSESLKAEAENNKAYEDLQHEFEQLKKQYEKTENRRKELARNNQSLGGRVAHTNRFRNERDAARAIVEEQKLKLRQLAQENEFLRQENQQLRAELEKVTQRGIVEIHSHETI
jgi:chromosome segregation ATPase